MSMKPGATIAPFASTTSASAHFQMLAHLDDDAVLDAHVAQGIEILRGVDDPPAAYEQPHEAARSAANGTVVGPLTKKSSTAMRM